MCLACYSACTRQSSSVIGVCTTTTAALPSNQDTTSHVPLASYSTSYVPPDYRGNHSVARSCPPQHCSPRPSVATTAASFRGAITTTVIASLRSGDIAGAVIRQCATRHVNGVCAQHHHPSCYGWFREFFLEETILCRVVWMGVGGGVGGAAWSNETVISHLTSID